MTKTYYLFRIRSVFGCCLMFFFFNYVAPAQNHLISGQITDGQEPISGASIIIKHTIKGTVSDFDGHYELDAQTTDTLQISYLGYKTQELVVGNQRTIDVVLQEDATALGEVVINAGYYTVKERERTGSIAKVDAQVIEEQPVNTALEALQGRVAGLDITQTTGLAGGGFVVRIRGQNSIAAGNEPLYVIDGVPYSTGSLGNQILSGQVLPRGNISPLNTLDPSSIASIEVLKDADATAIYGSRGANGVILITTKKGMLGKTQVTIDASSSMISVTKMMDLLNTGEYISMRREAFENDGITDYPANAYDVNGTWDPNRYTDWQEELLGNPAYNQTFKTLIQGGVSRTLFSLGGSFVKETTVFPKDFNYKRGTVFATISQGTNEDKFRLQFSTNYGTERNNLPSIDLTDKARQLAPNAPALYDEMGNLNWEDSTWENPLAELESIYENKSLNFMANTVLSYTLFQGLELKSNLGYNRSDLNELQLNPHTKYNPAYGLTSMSSNAFKNQATRYSWIIEPQVNASYRISKGQLSTTLGVTFQELQEEAYTLFGFGYSNNSLIDQFSSAQTLRVINETSNQYRYQALYARLNYNWKGKYILNLTGRRDGSSRFGPGNRFANFGAIGAAWIFSEESFLRGLSWLSYGKLRGSFGTTGNDQIGDYQYLDTYGVTNGTYDGNIGLAPTRLYNPNYAWEKNRKLEFALETSIIDGVLQFEIAYYHNKSNNQILGIPLPGTTGFSSINTNLAATVENSGFELSINTVNFQREDFDWKSNVQFTMPKNELTAFEGLEQSTYVNQLVIGEPLSILKQYHLLGVNTETGLFEFEDYNNDGIINTEDRQYISDLTPKYYGSISNTLRYKNWHLDFLFQFVKKEGYNELYGTDYSGGFWNQPDSVLDHWEEIGNETYMQAYTTGLQSDLVSSYSKFKQSNGVISDVSFVRLKSLSLTYNIPLKHTTIKDCIIYLRSQNLLTFTKLKSGDPEQYTGYMPPLKRVTLGMSLKL